MAALIFRFFESGQSVRLCVLFTKNDCPAPTYMPCFPIILMAWTPLKVLIQHFHFATLLSVSTSTYSYRLFPWNYSTAKVFLIHDGISCNTLIYSRLFKRLILQILLLLCSHQRSLSSLRMPWLTVAFRFACTIKVRDLVSQDRLFKLILLSMYMCVHVHARRVEWSLINLNCSVITWPAIWHFLKRNIKIWQI